MSKVINFIINTERIRQLGSQRGQQMNSAEAEAFVTLYAGQLEDRLAKTLKDFVGEKIGAVR